MAASTGQESARRPAPWRRWAIRLCTGVLVFLAATVALLAGSLVWLRLGLPSHEGTVSLPGLTAPVRVVTDADGFPHIFAAGLDDAYRALGYLHARDRLFQMEFMRRLAAGR